MFGSEHKPVGQGERTDWTGPIIVGLLSPVFLVFALLHMAEKGFTACIVLGLVMIAMKLRWAWRHQPWFWVTCGLVVALHIPAVFLVKWPQTSIPTLVFSLPLGIADFLLVSGSLSLARRLFSSSESSVD